MNRNFIRGKILMVNIWKSILLYHSSENAISFYNHYICKNVEVWQYQMLARMVLLHTTDVSVKLQNPTVN